MSTGMRLADAALADAGFALVGAAERMLRSGVRRPAALPTISGAGERVELYLRGLAVARAALADAATSAGHAVSATLAQSTELDAVIAATLPPGFSLGGGTP